jgi:hypothetical protein
VVAAQSQLITETFQNTCHSNPDPASMNYYLEQLQNGQTAGQIKESIRLSCKPAKMADVCQHVSGLSDLCKTATN